VAAEADSIVDRAQRVHDSLEGAGDPRRVQAAVGDEVTAGTPLLVVEAMKMEHVLTAPVAGTVTELGVTAGQSVRLDERVAVVTPPEPAPEEEN